MSEELDYLVTFTQQIKQAKEEIASFHKSSVRDDTSAVGKVSAKKDSPPTFISVGKHLKPTPNFEMSTRSENNRSFSTPRDGYPAKDKFQRSEIIKTTLSQKPEYGTGILSSKMHKISSEFDRDIDVDIPNMVSPGVSVMRKVNKPLLKNHHSIQQIYTPGNPHRKIRAIGQIGSYFQPAHIPVLKNSRSRSRSKNERLLNISVNQFGTQQDEEGLIDFYRQKFKRKESKKSFETKFKNNNLQDQLNTQKLLTNKFHDKFMKVKTINNQLKQEIQQNEKVLKIVLLKMQANKNHIYAGMKGNSDVHNLNLILTQKEKIKQLKMENKMLRVRAIGDEDEDQVYYLKNQISELEQKLHFYLTQISKCYQLMQQKKVKEVCTVLQTCVGQDTIIELGELPTQDKEAGLEQEIERLKVEIKNLQTSDRAEVIELKGKVVEFSEICQKQAKKIEEQIQSIKEMEEQNEKIKELEEQTIKIREAKSAVDPQIESIKKSNEDLKKSNEDLLKQIADLKQSFVCEKDSLNSEIAKLKEQNLQVKEDNQKMKEQSLQIKEDSLKVKEEAQKVREDAHKIKEEEIKKVNEEKEKVVQELNKSNQILIDDLNEQKKQVINQNESIIDKNTKLKDENESLQGQIKKLNEKLDSSSTELQNINTQIISEKSQKITKLEQEIQSMIAENTKQNEVLKLEIDQKQLEITNHLSKISELQNRIETSQSDSQKIQELEQINEINKSEIQVLEKRIEALVQEIKDKFDKIQELDKSIESQAQADLKITELESQLTQKSVKFEQEGPNFVVQLEEKNQQIIEMNKKLEEKNTKILHLEYFMYRATNRLYKLQKKEILAKSKVQKDADQPESSIEPKHNDSEFEQFKDNKKEVAQIQKKSDDFQIKIEELNKENEDLNNQCQQLDIENQSMKDQNEAMQNEIQNHKKNVERLEKECEQQMSQIKKLQLQVEITKTLEKEIRSLQVQLESNQSAKNELQFYKDELNGYKSIEQSLKSEIKSCESNVKTLQMQVENYKSQETEFNSLQVQLENYKSQEKEYNSLKSQLGNQNSQDSEVKSLKDQLENYKSQEAEFKSLKEQIQLQEESYKEKLKLYTTLEQDLKKQQQANQDLQTQLFDQSKEHEDSKLTMQKHFDTFREQRQQKINELQQELEASNTKLRYLEELSKNPVNFQLTSPGTQNFTLTTPAHDDLAYTQSEFTESLAKPKMQHKREASVSEFERAESNSDMPYDFGKSGNTQEELRYTEQSDMLGTKFQGTDQSNAQMTQIQSQRDTKQNDLLKTNFQATTNQSDLQKPEKSGNFKSSLDSKFQESGDFARDSQDFFSSQPMVPATMGDTKKQLDQIKAAVKEDEKWDFEQSYSSDDIARDSKQDLTMTDKSQAMKASSDFIQVQSSNLKENPQLVTFNAIQEDDDDFEVYDESSVKQTDDEYMTSQVVSDTDYKTDDNTQKLQEIIKKYNK